MGMGRGDAGVFNWRRDVKRRIKQEGFDPYNSVGAKNAAAYVEIDETVLVEPDDEGQDENYWRTAWGMR
jgi:hypothetical protein